MVVRKTKVSKADKAKGKMLELLESGNYKSGQRLPPESELVKILGCCRGTVREVIGLLVSDGYLSRIHGSGTYVAPGKRRHYTIAAIFPDLCKEPNDIYTTPPVVSAVVAEARNYDADIMLFGCGDEDRSIEHKNIMRAIERGVDAVVTWYIGEEDNLDALEALYAADIPVVFVDRYVEKFNPDYTVTDNYAGAYDAVNAIARMGVESICFVTNIGDCTSVRDRLRGYTDAVNSLGLSCNVVYSQISPIVKGVYSEARFDKQCNEYICLKRTIENIRLPAALFSDNPTVNTVVHEVLNDLNVPTDQVILGHFDSDPPMRITDRCYFEVDQPFAEIGAKAVRIAMDRVSGKTEHQQVALKPKLVIHNLSSFAGTKLAAGVSQ